MSKSHVSTVPMKPGAVNPAYGLVDGLLDRKSEFNQIARKIVALCRARFGKQSLSPTEMARFKTVVGEELAAEKAKWMEMVSAVVNIPPPPQVMPAPPPSKEIYGRVSDGSEIVDVGSGNCLRLVADSGRLKITAVDPDLSDLHVTIKKVQRAVTAEDVEGALVTSHNAVCQMPPSDARDAVLNTDGLHLVPDHVSLISMGCATKIGDRVAVNAPNQVFLDYEVPGPGFPIIPGYKIMPRYQSRELHFSASADIRSWCFGDYRPSIDCSPCGPADVDWNDMGWKWDGVPLEFEIMNDGKGVITRRDGSFVEAGVTGDIVPMSLHLEWLETQGILVLLRVECYRGFVPPHSGDMLRWFCERVRLVWNDAIMLAPPPFDVVKGPVVGGVTAPVDGIITRTRQRDYYVKPYWTLDLRPEDIRAVEARVLDLGKRLFVAPLEGLWEYRVNKHDETYYLEPVRRRDDKLTATPIGTVDYLLTLPTLREIAAITGSAPEVDGIANYFIDV